MESAHSGGSESEGKFIDWEGIGRATSVIETEQSKTAGVEQLHIDSDLKRKALPRNRAARAKTSYQPLSKGPKIKPTMEKGRRVKWEVAARRKELSSYT